jgi:potassium efflux system protein
VVFAIGYFISRWFQKWLAENIMRRSRIDTGLRNSVRTGIGYLGIIIAAVIGLSVAGLNLSNVALVAGALSVGIGFGLQNIVNNFVSGLILLVERPFKVGDWVVTGSTQGFVRHISVRATEIETFQRQSVIVPNSEFINTPVSNWTHRNSFGRCDVAVGVSYDSDPRRVMALLEEIGKTNDMVLKDPPPVAVFVGFGASSLDFELRVFLRDILYTIIVATDLRTKIFERFREEGIEIPFPQTDVHIKEPKPDENPAAEAAKARLQAEAREEEASQRRPRSSRGDPD